jgi:nucleoside-specific outer membrane channel protein Tsx
VQVLRTNGCERGLLLLGALALPATARAEEVSITSLQLLYGGPFDDAAFGNDTQSKQMFTVSFEHIGTWRYGDNYTLFDLTFGDFVDSEGMPTGEQAHFFGKWAPRVGVGKLLERDDGFGVWSDILIAGQLHVGIDGFYAYMIGAGADLELPTPYVLGVNAYYRKDKFNAPSYQVTTFWEAPIDVGVLSFRFRGYLDVFGSDASAAELAGQPQLLLDLGTVSESLRDTLQIGIELYLHLGAPNHTVAPQLLVRWIW